LKRGLRSIKDTVVFDEEEVTEEILQKRPRTSRAASISCTSVTKPSAGWQSGATVPAKKKEREHRRCRCQLGREMFGFRSSSATSVLPLGAQAP